MLRAAAVGGGAYYMGKRSAESRQQTEAAQPPPQAAPATPGSDGAGMNAEAVQRLQQLADLHKQGVLTDEEFATQKTRILGE